MLKLSIITVNLNNAAGLRKTIESVRAQTFKDFEHIIIDGDSTDESVAVIKKFEDGFSYWVSEPDGGIYQGMNKGTRVAKGEYCLYLNSGDYLYNSKVLEKVFKEKFSEDLVYGNSIIENITGEKICGYKNNLNLVNFYLNHQKIGRAHV
jgi:glycosyltransferase involved in cell wall biosynthesis